MSENYIEDKEPLLDIDDNGRPIRAAPGDYVEKNKCCHCIPLRMVVHIFSQLLVFLLVLMICAFIDNV